jgi:hypothetical protein
MAYGISQRHLNGIRNHNCTLDHLEILFIQLWDPETRTNSPPCNGCVYETAFSTYQEGCSFVRYEWMRVARDK